MLFVVIAVGSFPVAQPDDLSRQTNGWGQASNRFGFYNFINFIISFLFVSFVVQCHLV